MAHTTITVFTRRAYGEERVYPADSYQATAISDLTGCKTLTLSHIQALGALGFEFEEIPAPSPKGYKTVMERVKVGSFVEDCRRAQEQSNNTGQNSDTQ